ncbi:hypothetical protein TVAG_163970 [Trichomonas vaginalis G3]|uniref:Uncharacterized protein n=1 Tax=Trichomonas vaginalis (strain ATCC PRA-98 / G3) TaxID=412133 RepID=A2DG74_TRIV3|nr:hypothetical protein TVAGG3_0954080 [Trichomonas vaginalis G3]EAY20701.1 hypothetical protein TVAG_163970 [Trichomonas vaginalis G3]KAI5487421.1 hypothetical protein TVAGG3_0954080 [Trichomonas vaginalis G3]|eukprot:XP_001581687.1 hypothetical protein [Trichomonas vaginalis G3]
MATIPSETVLVAPPNPEATQEVPQNVQAFMRAYNEYRAILNETSPQYIENKEQIMQFYQSRISEIDNYKVMRNGLIDQESRFRAQIATDYAQD